MKPIILSASALAFLSLAACLPGEGVQRDFTGSVTCPGLSPAAQANLNATPDRLARCGPQTERPY